MKNITCCFSGHRDIPQKDYAKIRKRLEEEICNLINQGVKYFGAGGATGFDTMAALSVLKLKILSPHIKLILVLPCREQAEMWNNKDKKIYNKILKDADKVVYTSEYYFSGCMQKRNRHLVDNSGICICYLTKDGGGTAYTVNYATTKGLQVINIADCIVK